MVCFDCGIDVCGAFGQRYYGSDLKKRVLKAFQYLKERKKKKKNRL